MNVMPQTADRTPSSIALKRTLRDFKKGTKGSEWEVESFRRGYIHGESEK